MKLGLIGVLAICSQLLAVHYYMVSVFILGVDVGRVDETCQEKHLPADKCTKIRSNTEAKVRFRLILFKSISGELPRKTDDLNFNWDVNWDVNCAHDFDVPFSVLKMNILTQFFKDLWFDPFFTTDFLDGVHNHIHTVTRSIFKFVVNGADFHTDHTHVASLITDYDLTDHINLSVIPLDHFTIHLFRDKAEARKTPYNFEISKKNVSNLGPCAQATLKTTVKMKSIELTNKNGKTLDKWKDGKYKVITTATKGSVVKLYVDFKMKTQKRIANIVIVVNHVPLKRLESIYSSFSTPSYDIPFDVEASGVSNDQAKIEDPFDESQPAWEKPTKDKMFLNSNLFTKWDKAEEIIAATLHFECRVSLI